MEVAPEGVTQELELRDGSRLFGSRLSADLGLLTAVGDGEALAIPIVNVVWTF